MNTYCIGILSVNFDKLFAVATIVVFYGVATAYRLHTIESEKYIKVDAGQGRWCVALILFCSCNSVIPSGGRKKKKREKYRRFSPCEFRRACGRFCFLLPAAVQVSSERHLDAERGRGSRRAAKRRWIVKLLL